jgi:hypothetical protein
LNYGTGKPGEFVPQKVALLPPVAQLITPIGRRAVFQKSMIEARLAHKKAFGE